MLMGRATAIRWADKAADSVQRLKSALKESSPKTLDRKWTLRARQRSKKNSEQKDGHFNSEDPVGRFREDNKAVQI
jgi:hypothetical protein